MEGTPDMYRPLEVNARPSFYENENTHVACFSSSDLPPTTAAATPHASNRVPPSRQSLNRWYPAPLDFPGDVSVAPSARSGWGASARGFDAALALHPSVASGAEEAPCEQRLSEVVASHERLVRSLSPRRSARAAPSPPLRRRVDVCAAEPKTVAVVSPQLGTSQALRERRLRQIFPVTWQGELDEDDDDRRERGGAARHGEG